MFLSGVLFVCFLAGCWLYCLADAALTPATQFPGLPKRFWVAAIAMTFILGALVWMVARRSWRVRSWPFPAAGHPAYAAGPAYPAAAYDAFLAAEALARHPASRSKTAPGLVPIGPDDDPEFLRELAERIRRER